MTTEGCFHCGETNSCDCVGCYVRTRDGLVAGSCAWCAGREETTAFFAWLGRPLQREDWYLVRPESPARAYRRLKPLDEFRKFRETKIQAMRRTA